VSRGIIVGRDLSTGRQRHTMFSPHLPASGLETRVVFMGTPEFAMPSLRALAANAAPGRLWPGGLDLVGVVTRPDKPSGRGQTTLPSPIKATAQELGVPVYQPGPLRRPEALTMLRRLAPNLIVVAAFGQILPPEVLRLPERGCLNVHASLLPRHRGASPVAAAILAGDTTAGVTLMLMDEGLDTGPILAQRATTIAPDETTGELTTRLADLGAELLVALLPRWLAGGIAPAAQEPAEATMSHLLRKEDGQIDWTRPAAAIAHQVRAYAPWPGAFTTWRGRQLKVLRARPVPILDAPADSPALEPGTVFKEPGAGASGRPYVATGGPEALALEIVQLEGKRALPADEFLRGQAAILGARLGVPPDSAPPEPAPEPSSASPDDAPTAAP
jgi:methionyl-tRNA formyltransferase